MLKHTLVLIAVLSLAVVTRTTLHAQTDRLLRYLDARPRGQPVPTTPGRWWWP